MDVMSIQSECEPLDVAVLVTFFFSPFVRHVDGGILSANVGATQALQRQDMKLKRLLDVLGLGVAPDTGGVRCSFLTVTVVATSMPPS